VVWAYASAQHSHPALLAAVQEQTLLKCAPSRRPLPSHGEEQTSENPPRGNLTGAGENEKNLQPLWAMELNGAAVRRRGVEELKPSLLHVSFALQGFCSQTRRREGATQENTWPASRQVRGPTATRGTRPRSAGGGGAGGGGWR